LKFSRKEQNEFLGSIIKSLYNKLTASQTLRSSSSSLPSYLPLLLGYEVAFFNIFIATFKQRIVNLNTLLLNTNFHRMLNRHNLPPIFER